MVVSKVISEDTPAGRAGLVTGDVIVAADGRLLADPDDWTTVEANLQFGRPIQLNLDRAGRRVERALSVSPTTPDYWTTQPGAVMLTALLVQGVALAVALIIVWMRPGDPVAVLGAWVLGAVSVYTIVPPYRFAVVWRELPDGIGLLMWPAYISSQAVAAVLLTFFASFPRRAIRSAGAWAAVWAPMAIVLASQSYAAWRVIYTPSHAPTASISGLLSMSISGAYLVVGAAMLMLNYRRLSDANERRRVRIVVFGAFAGVIPGLLVVLISRIPGDAELTTSIFASRLTSLGTLGLLLFPASFAYAILRHRVFDVRVIIRQSVRYAIARGALLSLVPVLALSFVLDVRSRGPQPLTATLEARASVYLVLGGLALVAHRQRRQWLEQLDRHFFREQYDTRQVLGQVVEDVRALGDITLVAPRVVAHIEGALHPEWVALLVRARTDVSYTPLVAAPAGLAPPPLRVDTTLVALLRVLGKPFQVSSRTATWLTPQLSSADLGWLQEGGAELLVPVVTHGEHAESVLTLGGKRSQEPYTREDCELLNIIATNLALLFERPRSAVPGTFSLVGECPQCGLCDDASARHCAHDGALLIPRSLPRLFAARYRIDRRLGAGGFGTVYEAFDTALDRRVAIKTMREELLTEAGDSKRFQREARLAAGFVHANVVTVHDFGVDANGCAFIVMELLDGTTLRDVLMREGCLRPSRALGIMRDVCAAMDAAHRQRLVHRDLKPENIFLVNGSSHQTAKVLDFGLAVALNEPRQTVTDVGALVGSLGYMAPEQLRGDDVEPASDLWALAIIAYEMLSGSHPFAGRSPTELSALPSDSLIALAGPSGNVPAWTACAERLLSLDPACRPPTPAALLCELEQALMERAA